MIVLATLILGVLIVGCVLIVSDIDECCRRARAAECLGCLKGRMVPGCPVHDPQARRGAAGS